MSKLIIFRVLLGVPLILAVAVLVFSLLYFSKIDPAGMILGENATAEQVLIVHHRLGLDLSFAEQFTAWLTGALRGDLGVSYVTGDPVWPSVLARLPVTLSVMSGGMSLACVIGIFLGVVGIIRPGGLVDRAVTIIVALNLAIPGFWLGLLMASLFGVTLGWFPASGYTAWADSPVQWAWGLLLPWAAAGLHTSAVIARQTRSAMIETTSALYVTALRARGISPARILLFYQLRNAAIPVITTIGMQFSRIVGISLVVEQVFALPGLGTLVVDAVVSADRPVLLGSLLFVTAFIVMTFLVVDVVLGLINPKVRLS